MWPVFIQRLFIIVNSPFQVLIPEMEVDVVLILAFPTTAVRIKPGDASDGSFAALTIQAQYRDLKPGYGS